MSNKVFFEKKGMVNRSYEMKEAHDKNKVTEE